MRPRLMITSIVAVAALGIGGGLIAQSATATSTPEEDAELIAPEVEIGDNEFYTSDQIETVWDAVVDNYPVDLPPGYAFPLTAPAALYPADGSNALFQAGLPDMLAAQYWRCAWLDGFLHDPASGISSEDMDEAADLYLSLPSVSEFDQTGLTPEVLDQTAAELGYANRHAVLFDFTCGDFKK